MVICGMKPNAFETVAARMLARYGIEAICQLHLRLRPRTSGTVAVSRPDLRSHFGDRREAETAHWTDCDERLIDRE
jgi:hypothetical protein